MALNHWIAPGIPGERVPCGVASPDARVARSAGDVTCQRNGTPLEAGVGENVTRLKGKVAVITGGGSGIGRAIALAFGREEAQVALIGRRREALGEVVSQLTQADHQALAVTCDITQQKQVKAAIDEVEQKFGAISVLVNN